MNALGAVNLDAIGEVEYTLPSGVGIFVGGGVKAPLVNLGELGSFRETGYKTTGWGIYVGGRLPFTLGKVAGFAIKPSISFSSHVIPNFPDSGTLGLPQQISYFTSWIGGYVSVAYTKTFARRFFVEPVIGLGPTFGAFNTSPRKFGNGYLLVPAQLNLGIRF
jgi:hypothetical protein